MAKIKNASDQYSKKETEERMKAALRGARIAGHRPKQDISKSPRKPAKVKKKITKGS